MASSETLCACCLQLPALQHKRGGHALVTVGSSLYALGGWNSESFMDGVEVLDTRAGAWRAMPPMKTPHAYHAAALLDGRIYALGGMSSQQARLLCSC